MSAAPNEAIVAADRSSGRATLAGRLCKAAGVALAVLSQACAPSPQRDPARQSLRNAFVAVVESGDRALVERFLRAEPELAGASRWGRFGEPVTPLAAAVAKGDEDMVRLLLARGARADEAGSDENGRTSRSPLHYAARQRKPALVQLLLENGALAEARDDDGETPLHEAAARGSAEAAELLLQAGAPLDAVDELGRTPLHTAAESASDLAGAALLCARGANTELRDQDGRTPLALAEATLARAHSGGFAASYVAERERGVAFFRPGQICERLRGEARAGRPATLAAAEVAARESACLAGHAWSCGNAGAAFDDGSKVPEDDLRARDLFRRGCELGNGFSCGREGWFYLTGKGVARDEGRGVRLYQRACGLKEAFSCARLGEWYLEGRRVPRDPARAHDYLQKGCQGGDQKGCQALRGLEAAS